MKHLIPYSVGGILIILSLILFLNMPSSVVGNEAILAEFEVVQQKSLADDDDLVPLQRTDLDKLNSYVSSDPIAKGYMEELYWFVDNDEKDHLAHSLGFFETYLKTGKEDHCTPHELWHVALFFGHGYNELAEQQIEHADGSYAAWVSSQEEKRKKFPQFYLRFDDQQLQVKSAIEGLKAGNHSEEMLDELDRIGETGIC